MDSTNLAALLQQGQAPNANGQAQKQDFLRGAKGGGSFTPQGYSDSLPVPQKKMGIFIQQDVVFPFPYF